MLINVPQYIDVEDKIAGPLTAKQLLWLIGMGVILLIMWNMLSKIVFLIGGIPVLLLFLALAFYKPYGQPLANFMFQGVMFMFRPKIYVWRRMGKAQTNIPSVIKKKKAEPVISDKRVSLETLHDLAKVLDSQGSEHNDKIDEWISSHGQTKK